MTNSAEKPSESLIGLSDSDLVELARRGDGTAFELIIRRHNQALFRAARGVVDDEAQAQDVVQEAYFKAFKRLDSFQERSSLKTWLTRIVVNQASDISRRQQPVSPMKENVFFIYDHSSEGKVMTHEMVDHSTPEIEATCQEIKHLLEAATRRLPEIYRCVFILRDVEGLSVSDSAFCLDINEALVKKRLSRARKMLRDDLRNRIGSSVSEIFEFAGRRCDAVTSYVMDELKRRGVIANR